MSYDVVSFGGDRRPRWSAWAAARRWPLVILAGVVAALVGGGYLLGRPPEPSPPPDAPFPQADGVQITLCPDSGDSCEPGTPEQAVAEARKVPELTSVTLVTGEEARRRLYDAIVTREPQSPEEARYRSLAYPPHLRAGLRGPADLETVRRRLAGRPGIGRIFLTWPDFWAGKAQVAVALCAPRLASSGTCGTSYATRAQRDAVFALLREQDGVEEVFLEDRPFALRLARHRQPHLRFTLGQFSETLYARLDDPAKARAIAQAVVRQPGVAWARLVK
ncbi:hypothetical protein HCN51_27885 [Nonomuraea sp. FMUSA5-5]|uniref:FtsX extracellular domain-containing protein n=1 Tax=Nonomuraea composti TaxID=2720023 RepID=A0ABX1BA14_9ACTN|nr:hypothetical protein [Nonomuraea sp. FMUSA5-5]NJP93222.1 hypothetical protein [Nonomuraea sp. FMUSA5-5]